MNSTLFEPQNSDIKHLTATILMREQDSHPDPGDKLNFNPEIDKLRKHAKEHRVAKEPNLTIYTMTQTKLKDEVNRKYEEEREKKELAERMKPVNITTVRYNTKTNDVNNKTINFRSVDERTSNIISGFSALKTKEALDLEVLNSKIQGYNT
jgi:hypothetical protein